MVELRKRKTPPVAPPKPARKKSNSALAPKESKVAKAKEAVKNVVKPAPKDKNPANDTTPVAGGVPAAGSTIDIATFGGEIETHDGVTTTLAKLLAESKAGVVIFTYPKQNTPGCTKQACSFRDNYEPLTATGLSIYGLSTDAPKGNNSFRTKFSFPYTLLCDPSYNLIKPLGFANPPKSTHRGVFVVTTAGKVLANERGGPEPTVDVVRKIVATMGGDATQVEKPTLQDEPTQDDKDAAKNAAEVADTAAKLDGTPQPAAA